jgi:hypothetical protein
MVNREPSPPGSVGGELVRIVNGTNAKTRWVRWGMFATGLLAGIVAPYLGWRPYRMRLVLGISAVWFLIALVVAIGETRNRPPP